MIMIKSDKINYFNMFHKFSQFNSEFNLIVILKIDQFSVDMKYSKVNSVLLINQIVDV